MTRPRMLMLELVCTIWLAAVRNMRHQNPASTMVTLNHTMDGISDEAQSMRPYNPAEVTTDRNRSCRRRVDATAPISAPSATMAFSRP
ncbi:hypothetical protein D9M69_664600 [compost metagenome]